MSKHVVVLDRVTNTPKMIFLGFKETTQKDGLASNFFSQMFSTRYASVGDMRQVMSDRVKKAQDKYGFEVDAKTGKVSYPDGVKHVTIQDILPEFDNMEPAVVYRYISAQAYEDLSDVERRAYQPAIVPRTNFYQTNPETGEVMRDENGRAIVESTGAAYFTDSLGDILFRTAQIRDVSALENEKRFVMKPLDQDAFDMLEDCPAAIEAINARLQVATEQETAADDISAILMSSIEKSHIANLVMLSRLEGVVYPGAEMAVEKLAKMIIWLLGKDNISNKQIKDEYKMGYDKANIFLKELEDAALITRQRKGAKLSRIVIPQKIEDIPANIINLLNENGYSNAEIIKALNKKSILTDTQCKTD